MGVKPQPRATRSYSAMSSGGGCGPEKIAARRCTTSRTTWNDTLLLFRELVFQVVFDVSDEIERLCGAGMLCNRCNVDERRVVISLAWYAHASSGIRSRSYPASAHDPGRATRVAAESRGTVQRGRIEPASQIHPKSPQQKLPADDRSVDDRFSLCRSLFNPPTITMNRG